MTSSWENFKKTFDFSIRLIVLGIMAYLLGLYLIRKLVELYS